jgi:hypothetical protein
LCTTLQVYQTHDSGFDSCLIVVFFWRVFVVRTLSDGSEVPGFPDPGFRMTNSRIVALDYEHAVLRTGATDPSPASMGTSKPCHDVWTRQGISPLKVLGSA